MKLRNHAEDLLLSIHSLRSQERSLDGRPLLFIASCFGGLVVAEALNRAAVTSSRYSFVRQACVGVVFLATPFGGTTTTRKAQWLVAYHGLMGENTSLELIKDLDRSNGVLNNPSADFARNSSTEDYYLPTHCFYEMQPSNLPKKRPNCSSPS
ncbi:hypothetical protein N658DRAFT_109619 [Parathielavia hyrcaniae]|uniref:Uncharacterized protein n=1 Tax=Parathielavia hyrcaniae TaxID=113614 RepID=A0AAN6T4S3_9PEZI|nr:hypothetical protein N658DRAFT_109619 [Parathielavia hyrcaniae]